MRREPKRRLKAFVIELLIYSGLVTAYFFLVLHFLAHHLPGLYDRSKGLYAVVSLLLIVGQGVLLEAVTSALMRFIRARLD